MSEVKFKIHVPAEQYGFLEAEQEGTAEDAVKTYYEIKKELAEARKVEEENRKIPF